MWPTCKRERIHLILGSTILASVVVAGVILTFTGHMQQFYKTLLDIFQSRDHLRLYLESWGVWAPLAFIVLQSLQVVMAPIPGELTGIVGGFVFGTWSSVLYSSVGLTVGSVVAFCAARIVGLPLVKLVVCGETLDKFHFLTERRGIIGSLIFFIIPGFPKDILCYLLGLSPMGFITFAVVCGLGRIPGTAMLSWSGAAIYDKDWRLLIILSIVSAVCIGLFYFKGEKASLWLKSKCGPKLTTDA
ncbi:MAG: TVP38/TMEM64 family protein [Desulfomonile tiedjei]|uniref:TVP38/TMEM64 family membrane protein n=1 Tax=Desulfomonile tiedjei TaxID=2358 RepID=A0A9D6V266_9BACT|nr:TVP38/TMEM64 family protein [Desulfomonile tiedjei]